MKCSKCGATPISGKIMIQHENSTEELNLCDKCLHEFLKEHPELVNGADLGQMFRFFMTALSGMKMQDVQNRINATQEPAAGVKVCCPTCKQTLKDLQNTRRAGCAVCYSFYKDEIDRYLLSQCGENSQTINTASHENRAERLNLELKQAIKLEKFELAAKIRDDLKKLQK